MRLTTLHEEPPLASSMLFEGLLAIGTFGLPVISVEEEEMAEDQVEEIARKEMEEMTERDLMVVTTELQKALAVGGREEIWCLGGEDPLIGSRR
ncbi:hypothetical protein HPP92_023065 [Vanilla planifolia]|uniref:Uncharacterized protein n=1 Tax=Vanilla planifolia TaxID=51239 RepID=A0A835UFP9_VANPL|nr:hypothetical protein HPP92_023065 [Vanilla planifolia]